MIRRKPLTRKTPLRGDPAKTREWKNRTAKELPKRSTKRKKQEATYSVARREFLLAHPVCPLSGKPTSEIHHSARRTGEWLNLQRYWIAVHPLAHKWIEEHSDTAETAGLMDRMVMTYEQHIKHLAAHGLDPNEPLFYKQQRYYEQSLQLCRERFRVWCRKGYTD